jgi:hypothetical protein
MTTERRAATRRFAFKGRGHGGPLGRAVMRPPEERATSCRRRHERPGHSKLRGGTRGGPDFPTAVAAIEKTLQMLGVGHPAVPVSKTCRTTGSACRLVGAQLGWFRCRRAPRCEQQSCDTAAGRDRCLRWATNGPLIRRRALETAGNRCRLAPRAQDRRLRICTQSPPLSNGFRGAPGRTRTCDPRLRRPSLYPTELRGPGPRQSIQMSSGPGEDCRGVQPSHRSRRGMHSRQGTDRPCDRPGIDRGARI